MVNLFKYITCLKNIRIQNEKSKIVLLNKYVSCTGININLNHDMQMSNSKKEFAKTNHERF